ncbi:MAG: hypothetical protein LQ340_004193 [Diploschistes diacapsis]|nr:MAG: hypothetical protein LQ340_004193 [Diploschistes diacapsis]
MSSLQPQQPPPAQRQSSEAQDPSIEPSSHSEPQQPSERRESLSRSTASVDSQTLLLNNPTATITAPVSEASPTERDTRTTDEPQKCWICFSDETEDSPTSSRWRSPCSCALTAHESCLLDWVADLEAPSSRRRSGTPAKIECPQCKSKIFVARPKNYLVEAVNRVDSATSRLVVPGIVLTLVGSIWVGFTAHGMSSVYLVFGRRDFETLVGNLERLSLKWVVGFPVIPVVLILSRTTFADGVLPALPAIFLASNFQNNRTILSRSPAIWPPSAAMTVALLPYLRAVYNRLYERLFTKWEQKWMKEVQPRAGENGDGDVDHDHAHNHHNEGGIGFDWNLELEIVEEVEEEEQPAQRRRRNRNQARGEVLREAPGEPQAENARDATDQGEGEAQNNNEDQQGDRPENPEANRQAAVQRNGLVLTTSRIADAVMGALCFPAVASAMGELLRLGLPNKWTRPVFSGRPGLLHTKWGRSIIGGCLFVVMKDTLLLYSKYRTARDHRLRKILNYDKRSGRYVN